MKRLLLTVLSAAIVAAVAPIGPAAPAQAATAPVNLLNLGTGKILNWDGEVTTPPGGGLHEWVRLTPAGMPARPGFAAPYQLQNPVTHLCLQEYGDAERIVLTTCQTDPTADSPQLWQHHRMPDRIAHEHPWGFVFNRSSGRVLTARPAGGQPTYVVTVSPFDPQSPEAPLQLWTAITP